MTAAPAKIRALVVEDSYLMRLGTVTLLRTQSDIEVVGDVGDATEGLALYRRERPDVCVVDLRLPGMDGVALTTALRAEAPPAEILILSYYDGDEDVFRALRAGARGYLTKGVNASEFLTAVRTVAGKERYLPTALAGRLADRMLQPSLSLRELQVLELIFRGGSNRDIAKALSLAERTTGMYVGKILEKLDARSRTEAVSIALARGILRPK